MELYALIHNGNIFYWESFCEFIFCKTRLRGVRPVAYCNNLYCGMLRGSNWDQTLLH